MKLYFYLLNLFLFSPLFAGNSGIVSLTTTDQAIEFMVEISSTEKEKARDLMFRKYLHPNHGMLFLYDPPSFARFWMKNTYIPLDLVFIDAQDKIVQIYEKAKPLSQKLICSQQPIKAILELSAGSIARYNIKINQIIKFHKDKA